MLDTSVWAIINMERSEYFVFSLAFCASINSMNQRDYWKNWISLGGSLGCLLCSLLHRQRPAPAGSGGGGPKTAVKAGRDAEEEDGGAGAGRRRARGELVQRVADSPLDGVFRPRHRRHRPRGHKVLSILHHSFAGRSLTLWLCFRWTHTRMQAARTNGHKIKQRRSRAAHRLVFQAANTQSFFSPSSQRMQTFDQT